MLGRTIGKKLGLLILPLAILSFGSVSAEAAEQIDYSEKELLKILSGKTSKKNTSMGEVRLRGDHLGGEGYRYYEKDDRVYKQLTATRNPAVDPRILGLRLTITAQDNGAQTAQPYEFTAAPRLGGEISFGEGGTILLNGQPWVVSDNNGSQVNLTQDILLELLRQNPNLNLQTGSLAPGSSIVIDGAPTTVGSPSTIDMSTILTQIGMPNSSIGSFGFALPSQVGSYTVGSGNLIDPSKVKIKKKYNQIGPFVRASVVVGGGFLGLGNETPAILLKDSQGNLYLPPQSVLQRLRSDLLLQDTKEAQKFLSALDGMAYDKIKAKALIPGGGSGTFQYDSSGLQGYQFEISAPSTTTFPVGSNIGGSNIAWTQPAGPAIIDLSSVGSPGSNVTTIPYGIHIRPGAGGIPSGFSIDTFKTNLGNLGIPASVISQIGFNPNTGVITLPANLPSNQINVIRNNLGGGWQYTIANHPEGVVAQPGARIEIDSGIPTGTIGSHLSSTRTNLMPPKEINLGSTGMFLRVYDESAGKYVRLKIVGNRTENGAWIKINNEWVKSDGNAVAGGGNKSPAPTAPSVTKEPSDKETVIGVVARIIQEFNKETGEEVGSEKRESVNPPVDPTTGEILQFRGKKS